MAGMLISVWLDSEYGHVIPHSALNGNTTQHVYSKILFLFVLGKRGQEPNISNKKHPRQQG
jgi:hypothetical protein